MAIGATLSYVAKSDWSGDMSAILIVTSNAPKCRIRSI